GERNTATIADAIGTRRTGEINELAVARIGKQTIAFITVPRVVADKLIAEECALLVLLNVRDRAARERQSEIVCQFVGDPAVGCVDVELRIIVHIEERHAPAPTRAAGVAVFQFAESAVAVVDEERIALADLCADLGPLRPYQFVEVPVLASVLHYP